MFYAIAAILLLTGFVWLIKKTFGLKLCPICAGVSLTWLGLWLGLRLGQLSAADFELPTALLLGGTVVGLMSKLEPGIEPEFVLRWKTIFVGAGFLAAYGLIAGQWLPFAVGVTVALVVTAVRRAPRLGGRGQLDSAQVEALKEKMKSCC